MNDVKAELSPRDVDEKNVHPHDGEQPKVEILPKESMQRPGTPPQTPENENKTIATDLRIESTAGDGDSEAETLIESPEKRRQQSDNAVTLEAKRTNGTDENSLRKESNDVATAAKPRKRKRDDQENVGSSSAVRASSPRSSALSSPGLSSESGAGYTSDSGSRRSTVYSKNSGSRRSDNAHRRSEEIDEQQDDGRLQVRKRRLSSSLHGDDKRLSAKQREKGGSGTASLSERRETRSATYSRHSSNERSVSPQSTSKNHKRGHSGQTTQSSFTTAATAKKQRLPPPLITSKRNRSEDRQSVSTNNSTSPAPSVPQLRKLVSTENEAVSPMKLVGQHRKHRDQNGRTWLARACANDELEQAKAYYDERPSDLNLPDNAGNTPLQIAALSGFADIVKFLVSKGCEVDTKNIDNDTPLIDAVENGHLHVIKLLLDHGANPRLGNAKGDEPYELVPSDIDNYTEIRQLLSDARTKEARRRQSDDHVGKDGTSRAASAVSPRDSPPILGPKSPPFLGTSSRRRTGRSESSRKDLLWQHHTQSNLTRLAATGDLEGVANVLNSLQKAEPDSVIAAARAGHDEVLSFLLGMGNPDPDPDPSLPTQQHRRGLHTPILAAIGRGNNKVVQLLLDQNGFNPRRKFEGMTYPEISMKRKGEGWEEEYKLLKQAYENARSPKSRKHESPRKHRDQEKLESWSRDSSSPVLRKPPRSPNAHHRDSPLKVPSKDVKRDITGRRHLSVDSKPHLRKTNSGDHSIAVTSDQDGRSSETHVKKHKTRRSQSDLPSMAPDGEGQKKRRLMSRKDHRELHSHRFHDSSSEEETSRQKKKEGPTITKLPLKRYRSSASPDRPRSGDSTMVRQDIRKRRRVFASSESPEESKSLTPRKKAKSGGDLGYSSEHSKQGREVKVLRDVEEIFKDQQKHEDQVSTPSGPLPTASIQQQSSEPVAAATTSLVPSEDAEMVDVEPDAKIDDEQRRAALAAAAEKANAEAAEKARIEAEAAAAAEKARVEEEKRLEAERQEKLRIEAEEKERAERIAKEEEEKRLKEAEAAAAAAAAAEAEAQRLREEEEERLRREEEEKAAAEAEAARKRAEEEAAEAAAAALRKKEEEERRERLRKEEEERQERMAREREERQRALEERRRREAEERERQRREALPPLFAKHTELVERNDPIARDHTWLKLTFPIRHAELGQIDPAFAQSEAGRELFITNFQAALLLATKDFNLTPFTQLERKPTTEFHRRLLFNTFKAVLWIDYTSNGPYLSPAEAHRRTMIVEPKFMVMDSVFWIRLSDFKDLIPLHPHLKGFPLVTRPMMMHFPVFEPPPPYPPLSTSTSTSPLPPPSPSSADDAAATATAAQRSPPVDGPSISGGVKGLGVSVAPEVRLVNGVNGT